MAEGDGTPYVFHQRGSQLGDFRKSWDAACKAAAGIDQRVAMETPAKTISVFRRYRIVSDDDVRRA